MTNFLNDVKFGNKSVSKTDEDDKFDIPIDISDIMNVCKEYSKLGWQIQKQIEYMLEMGIEDSIKNGYLKPEALPHIKDFLFKICENSWFGDANIESNNLIFLIDNFEIKYPELFMTKIN